MSVNFKVISNKKKFIQKDNVFFMKNYTEITEQFNILEYFDLFINLTTHYTNFDLDSLIEIFTYTENIEDIESKLDEYFNTDKEAKLQKLKEVSELPLNRKDKRLILKLIELIETNHIIIYSIAS